MANSGDGSVEIRIKGSVDASVAAATTEAKSQMAGLANSTTVSASTMAKALQAAGGDVRKITPDMLGIGTAAVEAAAVTEAAAASTGEAMKGIKLATSGAIQEYIRLGHEAMTGNFSRMPGSAVVLASRMGGLETAMTGATGAMVGMGVAAAAGVATMAYFAYEEYEAQKAAMGMAEAFALTGRAAGNSAEAIRAQIDGLADMDGVSREAAMSLVEFDAAHADVNARISEGANQLAPQFVKAWGEDGPAALNKLKEGLAEIEHAAPEQSIRQFEHLNQAMLNLKPAEAQIIEGMIESGNAIGAVNRILADLATQGGGHIDSLNQQIVATQRELATAKREVDALNISVEMQSDPEAITGIWAAADKAAQKVAELQRRLIQLNAGLAATPANGMDPADAYARSHATLLSLRDSATRARDAVAELHREMEVRRKTSPNDPEVRDYFANQAKRDHDLEHREDPGDFRKPHKPRAKAGESPMTRMETELQQSEFKIKSQTGDWQRDMQDFEVKFWQGKLSAATKGSKLYGDILRRVEQAQLAGGAAKAGQTRQMSVSDTDSELTVQKTDIGDRRAAAQADFEAGKITAEAKRDLLRQLAQEEAQDEIDAQEKKKAAYGADVVAVREATGREKEIRAALIAQLNALDRGYTADLDQQNRKRAEDAKRAARLQAEGWRQANSVVLESESRLVSGIIGGRQSLSRIMLGIAANLVEREIQDDLRYLTEKRLLNMEGLASDQPTAHGGFLVHMMGETAKSGATAAGTAARVSTTATGAAASSAIVSAHNMKEITSHAATAAAAAYHAMAGIPVIGPALGAVAAATTFVAVEAFGALASFDKGTNSLPTDMIAQVHAGERIVPAADNRELMNLARGGGGKSVTMNNHFSPTVNAPQQASLKQMLEDQASDMFAFMRRAHRDGVFR